MTGDKIAKTFGIDTEHRARNEPAEAVRSAAVSIRGFDPYEEEEVSVKDWLRDIAPTKERAAHYTQSLFPFW
jgi:hypothetical protein